MAPWRRERPWTSPPRFFFTREPVQRYKKRWGFGGERGLHGHQALAVRVRLRVFPSVLGLIRIVLVHPIFAAVSSHLYAMGNQLLIDLHGVDDDPVTDLDIGLLNRLLGALVGSHLRVEADFNGLSRLLF